MLLMSCRFPRNFGMLRFLATLSSVLGLMLSLSLWTQAQGNDELIRNGAMEGGSGPDGKGGGVPDWMPYGTGYQVDRREHHGGDQCIRCDSLNPESQRGAQVM